MHIGLSTFPLTMTQTCRGRSIDNVIIVRLDDAMCASILDDVGRTAADVAVPLSSVIVTVVGAARSKEVNEVSFASDVCGTFVLASFCRAATDVNHTKDGAPPTLAVYHGDGATAP
jgi:hypothetical protein